MKVQLRITSTKSTFVELKLVASKITVTNELTTIIDSLTKRRIKVTPGQLHSLVINDPETGFEVQLPPLPNVKDLEAQQRKSSKA